MRKFKYDHYKTGTRKKVLEPGVNCRRQSFVFDLFKGRDASMESY